MNWLITTPWKSKICIWKVLEMPLTFMYKMQHKQCGRPRHWTVMPQRRKLKLIFVLNWFSQVPVGCVPYRHCGVQEPIYVDRGVHPRAKYDLHKFNASFCKTNTRQCCGSVNGAIIRHCGDFYVYKNFWMSTCFYNPGTSSQLCATYKQSKNLFYNNINTNNKSTSPDCMPAWV